MKPILAWITALRAAKSPDNTYRKTVGVIFMPEWMCEMMKWRIYPSQRGWVNRLVRRRCCCYDHGRCILLDDGEPHRCVQVISRSGICCNYFHRAVLPSDSELYTQIRNQNK